MSHVKWTKIVSFHNIVKSIRTTFQDTEIPYPIVTYRAKIKLHGTNAGVRIDSDGVIAQSRTQDISQQNDNVGFAKWVANNENYFAQFDRGIVIFGEWVGPGIQKGTAINQISNKSFCVFAIQIENNMIVDPSHITQLCEKQHKPDNMCILPWATKSQTIDFSNHDALVKFIDCVNNKVHTVEECDPWVKEEFNIEGIGEGLVYYPQDSTTQYIFKAKGEKHQVKKAKKPAQIDPDVLANIDEFVLSFVTLPRLQQGASEACGGKYDVKLMGSFLKWFGNDVKKEGVDELEASGLEWKQVARAVSFKARGWYLLRAKEEI